MGSLILSHLMLPETFMPSGPWCASTGYLKGCHVEKDLNVVFGLMEDMILNTEETFVEGTDLKQSKEDLG